MPSDADLPPLNTFWVGPQLGDLEMACLESAARVGHCVRVFSYGSLDRLPEGAEARDASEVASFELVREYVNRGSHAVAANIWRLALLRKGLGIWIDADVYVLRPIVSHEDCLFGWQDARLINNAVLYLQPDSTLLARLWEFVSEEQWAGSLDRLTFGATGPKALTRFATETGDACAALERRVFYPIPYQMVLAIYQPTGDWRRWCSDQTVAIHLWHSLLPRSVVKNPLEGTLLHEIMECHRRGSGVLNMWGER